jgi:hypothetical protein
MSRIDFNGARGHSCLFQHFPDEIRNRLFPATDTGNTHQLQDSIDGILFI